MLTHTVASTRPAPVVLAEPFLAKWMLIGVAVVFLGLFLVLPLVAIFVQAFDVGAGRLLGGDLRGRSVERLHADADRRVGRGAAQSVFGVAAAWAVTRFSFPRQTVAGRA